MKMVIELRKDLQAAERQLTVPLQEAVGLLFGIHLLFLAIHHQ